MSERDGEWILVLSFAELTIGVAIRMRRPCRLCGQRHLGNVTTAPYLDDDEPKVDTSMMCGKAARMLSAPSRARMCIGETAVRGEAIERLRPDAPAASDETIRPAKVRVPVEAGR